MHCLDCGYNLNDLIDQRCPECGRLFDPHDNATWGTTSSAKRRTICIWLGRIAIIEMTIIVIYSGYHLFFGSALIPVIVVSTLFGGPVVVATGLAWLFSHDGVHALSIRKQTTTLSILFILFASFMTRWPFYTAFWLSQPALDRIATQCDAGNPPAGPITVGVFRIESIEQHHGCWALFIEGTDGVLIYVTADNEDHFVDRYLEYKTITDDWQIGNKPL